MINIFLIGHNCKESEIVSLAINNRKILEETAIYTTGTTGGLMEKEWFHMNKFFSSPRDGDAQINAIIVEGKMDVVIPIGEPLDKYPCEPDIQKLMRMDDFCNISLVTNCRTTHDTLNGIIATH